MPEHNEKLRFAANTVLNGASQFASLLASLVFLPLLISTFGIAEYGLFMLVSSVTAYTALLDLGVGSALTKMVAEYSTRDDSDAMNRVVSSALFFYCIVGVVVAAVMVALGFLVGAVFDVDAAGASLLRNMLWLGAVFQLAYWTASTGRYVLAGLQRFDLLAKTAAVATALNIGSIALVIAIGEGPLVLVGLVGITTVLTSTWNVIMAARLSGIRRVSFSLQSLTHLTAIFSFSWAIFVIQLSDALFYQQTDRVLLGIVSGAVAVGLYEAAAKFNVLVTYLSSLTISAVLPLASSMGAEGRHASLRSLFIRGTKYTAALVTPITVVLVLFARPLIQAWLGDDFAEQAIVAQVLVFPHLLVSLGLMGDAIVTSQGRLGKRVPYILAQAVLNVVLSILLIPRFGILGVALGTAAGHLIDFPLHLQWLLKETRVSLGQWTREVVMPVYPLLLLPLVVGYGLSLTALADSIAGIMAAGSVMVLVYWIALYAVALSELEREEAKSVFRAIQARLRPANSR